MRRCHIEISGLVQGVGFRPFVYRLAVKHRITGSIRNTWQGVAIEAEGLDSDLASFLQELHDDPPIASRISGLTSVDEPIQGSQSFHIMESHADGISATVMPHDRSPCATCLDELSDSANRRYRYPFISCNECGPRFTITEALPFDRKNTTMRDFELCNLCQDEYLDPSNRRFHAQTISCPGCGPKLLFNKNGKNPVESAISVIKQGGLISVKGIGGYQLVCSALALQSIERLRRFKERKLKPFAIMAPSLDEVRRLCFVSPVEAECLQSPVAPVVLLYVKDTNQLLTSVHPQVAPGLTTLGVMLPTSPLHHLLMAGAKEWLIITSANRPGATMHTDDSEATSELGTVVAGILSHDRAIAHVADDSVIRVAADHPIVLRLARGLAPAELRSSLFETEADGIALGGHSKSAFALAIRDRLILSQHLGELDNRRTLEVFRGELEAYKKLYGFEGEPDIICRDAHSGYGSIKFADEWGSRIQSIYHHEAHLESLLAEHCPTRPALGVVCDGSGLGRDNSIWGGEFFLVQDLKRVRVGSLKPFRLPGGEQAIKEPRRSAFGMLHETYGSDAVIDPFFLREFTDFEQRLISTALSRGINCPYTSSLGRLFDGFAALLGLCVIADYEAQAPMGMEALAHGAAEEAPFPVIWKRDPTGFWRWDWGNLLTYAQEARECAADRRKFAAAFHTTIVQAIEDLTQHLQVKTVLLSGGVFQNAVLLERCHKRLDAAGIAVISHKIVPPGDGGLALGQIVAGRRKAKGYVSRNSG